MAKKNATEKNKSTEPVIESDSKVEMVAKVPRILLEIFVYGVEKDKKQIKTFLDQLQGQIEKSRRNRKYKVRILWYVDKGEKTEDEKKQWMLENCNCKYYVFAPTLYVVSDSYVKTLLDKIQKLEDSIQGIKDYGIMISKKKADSE